ncbi:MAG: DUF362 domain-containing protein [Actinobacteria bacterium]|nr:DUF362 domain-containing protein [Actinomycetota bacterium]
MEEILIKKVENYDDYESILSFAKETIDSFLMEEADLKGKRILLKPNLLMKKPPEAAVTTHPVVVRAFAELLKQKGASLFIGESPGGKNTKNSFEKALKVSGLEPIIRDYDIDIVFFDSESEEKNIGGKLRANLQIFDPDDKFDFIINLCKFKTHGFMGLTCAVKNIFGFVVGTAKAQCHLRFTEPEDFADMLLDLALYIKPSLSVVDGIISMDREGPSSGRAVKTGFLAASRNPFILDYHLSKAAKLDLNRIYTITASKKRGLLDSEYVVKGDTLDLLGFEMPQKTRVLSSSRIFKWFRGQLTALPYYDKNICRKCYECIKNCPPQVIRKDSKGYPVLKDSENCIRCYCCVELCPYEAAKIKQPLLLKIFKKYL